MAYNNRNQDDPSYNYNQDWDENRRRYNRADDDYMQRRTNYENRNYDRNQEFWNRGDYGDMRNASYGSIYGGNVEQRERETNQAQGGRYRNYNEMNRDQYQNRPYNAAGNYNDRERYNRDWNDERQNFSGYNNRSDYGSYYGSGNYNDQGNRNYDNMNRNRNDRGVWDKTKDEVASWFGDDDAERRRDRDERMSGEHKGKGPRGYQRSNERIREDVCDRLSDDDYLDATDIDVKVENNEVILTGTVNNREQKRRAEDLVESISGVRNVENRIKVNYNDNTSRNRNDRSDIDQRYTEPNDIGRESGTTNEIIRDTGNMNKNR